MPLEEAVAWIEGDPIALEIMWSRLVNVVEEMSLTVSRTAFSIIISEAQDFACDLLDVNVSDLLHAARLSRILPAWSCPVEALCLYFPSRRRQSAACAHSLRL